MLETARGGLLRAGLGFDEVDVGVGGRSGGVVGEKLWGLTTSHQVLCITHLPQVASQGHQHLRVSKLSDGRSTRTQVTALSAVSTGVADARKVMEGARGSM